MTATDGPSAAEAFTKAFTALVEEITEQAKGTGQAEPNRLLTPKEVGVRLGMSERSARDLTYSHHGQPPELATVRIGGGGGGVRIEESALEAFIEARRVAGRAKTRR